MITTVTTIIYFSCHVFLYAHGYFNSLVYTLVLHRYNIYYFNYIYVSLHTLTPHHILNYAHMYQLTVTVVQEHLQSLCRPINIMNVEIVVYKKINRKKITLL